jgi:ligand-binding SRPBCC domain-containing protein
MSACRIQFVESPDAGGFRLQAEQFLPQPRESLFEFFSDAFQLETITPPSLRFSVRTPAPIRIEAGTLIDYRLSLHGIPMRWRSRISLWEPPYRFVDEQLRGPYRHWHHLHEFEEADGGTLCRDIVDYRVPGGRLIESLLVRPDLRKIFTFRQKKLAELFTSH